MSTKAIQTIELVIPIRCGTVSALIGCNNIHCMYCPFNQHGAIRPKNILNEFLNEYKNSKSN